MSLCFFVRKRQVRKGIYYFFSYCMSSNTFTESQQASIVKEIKSAIKSSEANTGNKIDMTSIWNRVLVLVTSILVMVNIYVVQYIFHGRHVSQEERMEKRRFNEMTLSTLTTISFSLDKLMTLTQENKARIDSLSKEFHDDIMNTEARRRFVDNARKEESRKVINELKQEFKPLLFAKPKSLDEAVPILHQTINNDNNKLKAGITTRVKTRE